ncbi:MAG: hypothetical protein SWY16_11785 [Cyanobacteriota bacterium]|nr:hypothetical protein [Cyanobacteriota bacterium]
MFDSSGSIAKKRQTLRTRQVGSVIGLWRTISQFSPFADRV